MSVHAERRRVKRTIALVQTNVSLGGVNRGDEGDHCDHIRGAVDTNNNMQQHTRTIRGGRLKTSQESPTSPSKGAMRPGKCRPSRLVYYHGPRRGLHGHGHGHGHRDHGPEGGDRHGHDGYDHPRHQRQGTGQ